MPMMDFHAAMETFAEAWVAANTTTPISDNPSTVQPVHSEEEAPARVDSAATASPGKLCQKMAHGLLQTINMAVTPMTTTADGVKSMPIHCIVEQVQANGVLAESPENGKLGLDSPSNMNKNSQGSASRRCNSPLVEMDTYAILPGTTMFSELVRTALIKIGYTASEALGAKGSIQIKKWKPLTFDTITDNPNCTVDEVLGDMTSIATLRIRLCSSVVLRFSKFGVSQEKLESFRALDVGGTDCNIEWTDEMVRCAVVDLLNGMNQSKLAKLSPLAQSTISNIANSKYMAKIGTEKCVEFGRWYHEHKRSQAQELESQAQGTPESIRVTFHPIYELPKMRGWFNAYPNPNDELFQSLVTELNEANIRKQRKLVTMKKLKIWWRNEKVRQKRIIGRIERGEDVIKSGRGRRKKDNNLSVIDNSQNDSFCLSQNVTGCQGHNSSSDNLMEQEQDRELEPPIRSPSGGTISPINMTQSASVSNTEQRNFVTIDRSHLPQQPHYPVPYIQISSNNIQDLPRGGHLELLSPSHSPSITASRYFSGHSVQEELSPPSQHGHHHPVYNQHRSPYNN